MSSTGCETCAWRARHDEKPSSLLARLWRWHADYCPGWKSYMKSLPDDEKRAIVEKYHFRANKFA